MHVSFAETEAQFWPASMFVPWLAEAECVIKCKMTRQSGGVARLQIPARKKLGIKTIPVSELLPDIHDGWGRARL